MSLFSEPSKRRYGVMALWRCNFLQVLSLLSLNGERSILFHRAALLISRI